jgi:hypothetical protein
MSTSCDAAVEPCSAIAKDAFVVLSVNAPRAMGGGRLPPLLLLPPPPPPPPPQEASMVRQAKIANSRSVCILGSRAIAFLLYF